MIGSCCRKASRPRKKAEPVSEKTSHFSARLCIQVPMLEVQAPNQSTRKSRCSSAAAMRRRPRAGAEPRGAGEWVRWGESANGNYPEAVWYHLAHRLQGTLAPCP